MNKITIIGNLTRDPELRTTQSGISICSFSVAVNRKKTQNNPEPGVDYFKVSAWRERGELCAKFLQKGKKVCVVGPVSVSTYTSQQDGKTYANLEVTAEEVEFISPRVSDAPVPQEPQTDQASGYLHIPEEELEDLPF